jgi:SAM-dependent methyltransferase
VTAPQPRTDHYSYSVYADPAMAESFEELRFGGPVGQLLARAQEEVLAEYLDPLDRRTVLDVGTGTGRAAIALARRGAVVTGVDASAGMLAVGRRRAEAAGVPVTFEPGDAHALPYGDVSFDSVVCLRVLMHTPDWRRALAELCRVARARVVFDYPALVSAAAVQAAARRLAHAAGMRVEAYRVFSDGSIETALASHGFRVTRSHRQFVLPIALHKRMNSVPLTERVERGLARFGLRARLGSPVTVLAERCGS